jgi:hypothetical protein
MSILDRSVPLVFERYGCKVYARTPGGEYAYSDDQGLYEWRGHERIHYSGGDRQASSGGGFHRHSAIVDMPFLRGLDALRARTGLS